jgi:cold shock CspA family protein
LTRAVRYSTGTPARQTDAEDIFCHGIALKRAGIHDIAVGDRLSFDIIESRKTRGKTEAANIQRIERRRIERINTGIVDAASAV